MRDLSMSVMRCFVFTICKKIPDQSIPTLSSISNMLYNIFEDSDSELECDIGRTVPASLILSLHCGPHHGEEVVSCEIFNTFGWNGSSRSTLQHPPGNSGGVMLHLCNGSVYKAYSR